MVEETGVAIEIAVERMFKAHNAECDEKRVSFVPLPLETFGALSLILKKTLNRSLILSDSRSYLPEGLSGSYNRLSQSLSTVIIKVSASMILARSI